MNAVAYFDMCNKIEQTRRLKSRKVTKLPILGFKVFQGHRCWYPQKARQQCLLW